MSNSTTLDLVPDGWFRRFLDLMVEAKNEMPLAFHFLVCATGMGQLIGLNSWVNVDPFTQVYPNVNTFLMSPGAITRRSSGTSIAMRLIKMAGARVFRGRLTAEALYDELHETSKECGVGYTLLYVDELAIMLNKREYMKNMLPTLTDLLSAGKSSYRERTRSRGVLEIPATNVSAVFTTAPDWFINTIPRDAFKGGFLSRFLVCHLESREVFNINTNPGDVDWDAKLSELATELAQLVANFPKGRLSLTPDAQEWLGPWYRDSEEEMIMDERLIPTRGRRPANVLRMATLLACSAGEYQISFNRLLQAIRIIDWYDKTLVGLMNLSDTIDSPIKAGEVVVLKYMDRKNGEIVSHEHVSKALARKLHSPRQRKECLLGLAEQGVLRMVQKKGIPKGHYPPIGWALDKSGE